MDILGDREMMVGGNQAFIADCGSGTIWGTDTVSPCRSCKKFKSYRGWTADACLQTCPILNPPSVISCYNSREKVDESECGDCIFPECNKKAANPNSDYCKDHTQIVLNRRNTYRLNYGKEAPIEHLHQKYIPRNEWAEPCKFPKCKKCAGYLSDWCRSHSKTITGRRRTWRSRNKTEIPWEAIIMPINAKINGKLCTMEAWVEYVGNTKK